ncbi:MAG: putative lipid II flippase FtsW [Pseudomonadota bacterium]
MPNSQTQTNKYEMYLLICVLILIGIGIIMVYSSSAVLAGKKFGDDYYFLKRQIASMAFGIIALTLFRSIPCNLYKKLVYPILLAGIGLLVLLLVPGVASEAGGAKRWLKLAGISFQPSEFVKIGLIIYLAYSMSKKQEKIKKFSIGFVPHAIVLVLIVVLLLMQPDFGTACIITMIAWVMLFVGGVRLTHLFTAAMAVVPIGYYVFMNAGYRLRRVIAFMRPWENESDAGYQIVHSFMAFGSGGVLGKGLGNSLQKLFYLPEPHTDFIFSVIGEELGLVGVCLILLLFSTILWIGFRLAMKSHGAFESYMATGITASLGISVIINIAVVMGLFPTKGLTLPFISYGGSSLVLSLSSVGILMSIARGSGKTKQS